jgi:hypothetical protein
MLSDEDVLSYLRLAPGPARLRELAHALQLRQKGRRELAKIITNLKRRKLIEEMPGGRFRLSSAKPEHTSETGRPVKSSKS